MKQTIIITIILVMLASFTLADLAADVEEVRSEIEGKKLPGFIGTVFGNEKINIHVNMEDGSEMLFGVHIEKKIIKKFQTAPLENPTIHFYAREETLQKIEKSEDPLQALKDYMDSGEITYKAVGFFKKIKFGLMSIFLGMSKETEQSEVEIVEKEETEPVVEEEPIIEEPVEEIEEEIPVEEPVEDEITGSVVEEIDEPKETTHVVEMNNDGFSEKDITISVGDTVTWKNVRSGSLNTAMLIGAQKCRAIKSSLFKSGESFSWTFDEPITCTFVDGIMTTKSMKVMVG